MAFGFAGAASGAAKSLEDIVAERLLTQKLEAEIANRQKLTEIEQAQLNQRAVEHSDNVKARQRDDDRMDADRRDRNNQQGVRRMIGESLMQGGEPDRKALAAMQIEAGDAPTMLNAPAQKKYQVKTTGPDGKPLERLVDEEEMAKGVPVYQEPKSGPAEKGPFVVGGNLVDANGRVIFRGQDASAQGPSPYAQERADRTTASVDDILGSVNNWTAGYGSMLSGVPQTDARSLKGKLDTLKANIAFNELTAMREASKTGGALGSIAVRELELLESALGSLDQGLDPEQLKTNLTAIRQSVERWKQAAGPKSTGMQPTTSHGAAPTAAPRRMRFDRTGKPIP